MKQTRLVLALIVTSLATPALSASLTMLQFGSFETRDEAEKKLNDITGKYKDTLGTLPASIREVKLPPDNLTVYRTQAGPVADRAAAQNICSKLASTGDECYIVQTAMVNAAPAATAMASTPLATELNKAKNTEVAAMGATPDLTSRLSTLQQPSAEGRDPLNRAALASMNAAPATTDYVANEQSPEMKAALDKAVAEQSVVANTVNETTSAATQDARGGFWSRMFGSSPKPAPAPVAKLPESAPVESVMAEPLQAPAVVAAPIVITPITPVATPQITTTSRMVAPASAIVASPSAGFDNSTVITQAPVMQLPPPPAPLKAQDRAMLAAGSKPLGAPEPVAAPINSVRLNVAPAPLVAGTGTVQVEEARRVPVTSTMTQPNNGAVPVVSSPFVQAPVSLRPSASEGMKTLWASIGPFNNNDDALAYWAAYRQNHPDFPVVRVRVASSLQAMTHGVNHYSLRIGPIAQRAFVRSLCDSLDVQQPGQPQPPKMQCGVVSDLGSSTALVPTPGMLPVSRYSNRH